MATIAKRSDLNGNAINSPVEMPHAKGAATRPETTHLGLSMNWRSEVVIIYSGGIHRLSSSAFSRHAGKKLCRVLTLSAPLVFCAGIVTVSQNLLQARTGTQHSRYMRSW